MGLDDPRGDRSAVFRWVARLTPWLCAVSLVVCVPVYGKLQAAHLVWTDQCRDLTNPCEGMVLELGLVKLVTLRSGGYTILSGHRRFDVRSDAPAGSVGDTVSVRAIYQDGVLLEQAAASHPYRYLKAYLGLLGLVLLLPFGLRYWEQLRGHSA